MNLPNSNPASTLQRRIGLRSAVCLNMLEMIGRRPVHHAAAGDCRRGLPSLGVAWVLARPSLWPTAWSGLNWARPSRVPEALTLFCAKSTPRARRQLAQLSLCSGR